MGVDWIINRWCVRERGIALFGPPPATLIDPLSNGEVIGAVRATEADLREWIADPEVEWYRPLHGYAILTACRMLYAVEHDAVASERVASAWAESTLGPEWSFLIGRARAWRAR